MLATLLVLAAAFGGCDMNNGDPLEQVFADMEQGFRNGQEELVRQYWTERGWEENRVPNSGLSGRRLFEQGARKGWYPRPDFSKTENRGKVTIVATELWSWKKGRSVDEIYFMLVREDEGWKIVGGGEDPEEVRRLAAGT